jgi:predicted nucleotidyltransferase component of viral defense system
MAESLFSLSRTDQAEALQVAAGRTGRPAHLLEKDIWVVWTLAAIYESQLASKLTFKGETSLSKVYRTLIDFRKILI